MTVSLDLPSDLENTLSAEAARLKLPLPEYILRVLATHPVLYSQPKTGAEIVSYWKEASVIDTHSDITNSQEYARHLRHEAETRRRA